MHIIKKTCQESILYSPLDASLFSLFLSDVKKWFELNLKLLHIGKFGGVGGIS